MFFIFDSSQILWKVLQHFGGERITVSCKKKKLKPILYAFIKNGYSLPPSVNKD